MIGPLKGGKIIVEKVFNGAKITGAGGTMIKKSSVVEGNLSNKVMQKVIQSAA